MSQQSNENEPPQGQHPAWSEYLEGIPEDLQPLVTQAFSKWDQHHQAKLQGVQQEFDPYKPLLENNVPMETIQQSLWLAQQLEENPGGIVEQAIQAFGLDYVPKSQIPTPNDENDGENFDMTDLEGLENHPAFKALKEKADEADRILRAQQEAQQETEATTQLEQYLEQLHGNEEITANGDFDDLYVTALMAQGVEAEDAIKQYQNTVNSAAQALAGQHQQQTPPPVVMGGDGNSGSGVPSEVPNMGNLSRGGLNDVVLQYLEQNRSSE